jgi:predicted SAM-dependent methyltransferase
MIHPRLKTPPFVISILAYVIARYQCVKGTRRLKQSLKQTDKPKQIVVGSSGIHDEGWTPTDIEYLNLLHPSDWDAFFKPNTIDAMLAEHVWEHLTPEHGAIAAANCFTYLKPGGYLRVAVPDGLHPDPVYREWVRVGGSGMGADDHKVLYTYQTFVALFEKAGFRCNLLEHFDEQGNFHATDWSPQKGRILRSKRFDERNQGGELNYTSIILDAIKP